MFGKNNDNPATLIYGPSEYRVVHPGRFVVCAVSGESIPLETLKYWSVERQEPYASAEISSARHLETA